MCSINGFNFADVKLIQDMISVQQHRGPDSRAMYTDNSVTLGHTRLSILDLSKHGRQPMKSADDKHVIVYNGEVYNYKEIRNDLEIAGYKFQSDTDTEVVLNAYKQWGAKCLNKFNGMFAFCIYDTETKQFFLARDRMGIKPLYYYFNNSKTPRESQFIFSSEIKAILQHPIKREINKDALNHYLAYRYNNSQQTLFKNIHKLPPGHYAIVDNKTKQLTISQWWDIKPDIINKPLAEYAKLLDQSLLRSVQRRLISDVPVGVYLSGGVDSSAIVSYMKELGQDIKSFSVNAGDPRFEDIKYANHVAEHFSTDHKEITIDLDIPKVIPKIVYHQDEPLADPASLPMYLMSQKVRPKAIVILNGAGGDELFAGYSHYPFLTNRQKFSKLAPLAKSTLKLLPASSAKLISNYFHSYGEKGKERILKFLETNNQGEQHSAMVEVVSHEERKELLNTTNDSHTSKSPTILHQLPINNLPFLQNILKTECKNFLVENVLMLTDKTTMASGLEARVPFLDHNIVNLAFQMPTSYLQSGMQSKIVLKQALKKRLPDDVLTRKKQGFYMPIDTWLNKDLKAPVQDSIQTLPKELLNQEAVNKIWQNYNQSPLYYARQLWTLYNLAEWHKVFIVGGKN